MAVLACDVLQIDRGVGRGVVSSRWVYWRFRIHPGGVAWEAAGGILSHYRWKRNRMLRLVEGGVYRLVTSWKRTISIVNVSC